MSADATDDFTTRFYRPRPELFFAAKVLAMGMLVAAVGSERKGVRCGALDFRISRMSNDRLMVIFNNPF